MFVVVIQGSALFRLAPLLESIGVISKFCSGKQAITGSLKGEQFTVRNVRRNVACGGWEILGIVIHKVSFTRSNTVSSKKDDALCCYCCHRL